jgi:hypothetical protein
MKRTFIALALALSLGTGAAGVASAQSNTATMDVGLTMLELAVGNEFSRIGMTDVDLQALTLNQLSEIKAILGDNDLTNTEKQERARAVVER